MTEASAVEERRRRDVPVGVVMVGMAAIAWWPAFTLGAWGEIFFDDVLALWAASTAAFVFVLVERKPVGARLARAFVLLLPTAWLVINFAASGQSDDDLAGAIVDIVAIVVVLIGIPFTLWVLVRVVFPDFAGLTRRRTRWMIAIVVLSIVVVSFLLGVNQDKFLTCEDFTISGNAEPEGCVPAS